MICGGKVDKFSQYVTCFWLSTLDSCYAQVVSCTYILLHKLLDVFSTRCDGVGQCANVHNFCWLKTVDNAWILF